MEPLEALRFVILIAMFSLVWMWLMPLRTCSQCDHCKATSRMAKEAREKKREEMQRKDHSTWHLAGMSKDCPWCKDKEEGGASPPPSSKEK